MSASPIGRRHTVSFRSAACGCIFMESNSGDRHHESVRANEGAQRAWLECSVDELAPISQTGEIVARHRFSKLAGRSIRAYRGDSSMRPEARRTQARVGSTRVGSRWFRQAGFSDIVASACQRSEGGRIESQIDSDDGRFTVVSVRVDIPERGEVVLRLLPFPDAHVVE